MNVVDDMAAASELVASGSDVVLLVAEDSEPGALPDGPGRLAVMVGDPGDPGTVAAAKAMYSELFARRP